MIFPTFYIIILKNCYIIILHYYAPQSMKENYASEIQNTKIKLRRHARRLKLKSTEAHNGLNFIYKNIRLHLSLETSEESEEDNLNDIIVIVSPSYNI